MGKRERYKEHAKALRRIAEGLPDSNAKRMILSIARSYDHLAGVVGNEDLANAENAAITPPESAPIAALKTDEPGESK